MESTASTTLRRSTLARIGDLLLTLLAVAGSLCIVLVILGWAFNVSLMMFRTGSMDPTIPAGSVAVVREIPAVEMQEGDVVTVDRGEGVLPVTHRVVAIEETDLASGQVSFKMRGDANDVDDPEPYTATEVRRVTFSVPGAARIVQWFGDPYVLGGLTLGATALVIWAFWPRERESQDGADEPGTDEPDPDDPDPDVPSIEEPGTSTSATTRHAALPLLAALVLTAPPVDHPETTLITGEHLRMQTSGDPAQMQNLTPGRPVVWEVGVWADAPDPGEIRLGIAGRGELAEREGALRVSVQSCTEEWTADRCPGGADELLTGESLDRLSATDPSPLLATMPSDEERWLRIEVVLDASEGIAGADGDVIIHAAGAGEEISAGPDDPAPGDDPPPGDTPPPGESSPPGTTPPPGSETPPGSAGPGTGDDLARTGASGNTALLAAGLLTVALGVALRSGRPRGRRS